MADDKEPAVEEKAKPAWKGSLSSSKPLKTADGHETLTKEDIDARDS
jgi:hypothetical protein